MVGLARTGPVEVPAWQVEIRAGPLPGSMELSEGPMQLVERPALGITELAEVANVNGRGSRSGNNGAGRGTTGNSRESILLMNKQGET